MITSAVEGQKLIRVDTVTGETEAVVQRDTAVRYWWPRVVPGFDAVLVNDQRLGSTSMLDARPIVQEWFDNRPRDVLPVAGTGPLYVAGGFLAALRRRRRRRERAL